MKEWPYNEVRKLAKLTVDEQSSFEEKLGTNTVKILLDFRDVSLHFALIPFIIVLKIYKIVFRFQGRDGTDSTDFLDRDSVLIRGYVSD